MNKIIATGKLIKISHGKRFNTHLLVVIKLPNQPDSYISFATNDAIDSAIKLNDTITVEGYLRGYNEQDNKGKWKVIHYFEAEKITLTKTVFQKEFNLPGHYNASHQFIGYVSGEIKSVVNLQNNKKSIILAIYEGKDIPDMATVVLEYDVHIQNEYEQIKKGDSVSLILYPKTKIKTINGKEKSITNLIVRDLAITA